MLTMEKRIRQKTHVRVVWAIIPVGEPCWFGIRNFAQLPDNTSVNHALFTLNDPNLKTRVLRLGDDLVFMQSVESFCGILARC